MALVIATLIITAGYVGYHAWQESIHEEPEKHSQPIEIQKKHSEMIVLASYEKYDFNALAS